MGHEHASRPRRVARAAAANVGAAGLLAVAARRRSKGPIRAIALASLGILWARTYLRYRRAGRAQTAREYDELATATATAFDRHYNEQVPTVEEEFELWGPYHRHRHEMRYDCVAEAVDERLDDGGTVLDVGCGSALVAERLRERTARYVGVDFGGHHIRFAAAKPRQAGDHLERRFVRGDAERLPMVDEMCDVAVMTEVIEHLLRPERAVWELARVLKPGGSLVLTTNNASEVPLVSPLRNPLAWLEKVAGADIPSLISLRPWVWPVPVDPLLLDDGDGPVFLPHTHHIAAETSELLAAAGLRVVRWGTFEFPPPQSATASALARAGAAGRAAADAIEAVAQRTPAVRRLGCHLFVVATKVDAPVAPTPPPGIWPGPFSS